LDLDLDLDLNVYDPVYDKPTAARKATLKLGHKLKTQQLSQLSPKIIYHTKTIFIPDKISLNMDKRKVDQLENLVGLLFTKVSKVEGNVTDLQERVEILEDATSQGNPIQGGGGAMNLDAMIEQLGGAKATTKGSLKERLASDTKPKINNASSSKALLLDFTTEGKCLGYDEMLDTEITETPEFDYDFPATDQHPEALVSVLRRIIYLNNRDATKTAIANALSKKRRQFSEGV